MSSSRNMRKKFLSLHEILEEIEHDDEEILPRAISILPPQNANAEVTDEDSGDEEYTTLNNLPGSQLRAPAEIEFECNSSSELDSDDEYIVPLASIAKKRRLLEDPMSEPAPSTSGSQDFEATAQQVFPIHIRKNHIYTWRNRACSIELPEWQTDQGPKNKKQPLDYFFSLLNHEVIDLLVKYSNLYAHQKNKIGNITAQEIKCFLAILLYSGYVQVPRRYIYWEKASDCNFDLIANGMSRDRFTFIMTHLHCCDNTLIRQSTDKFAKMRPLFDILNKNFMDHSPIEEARSFDEGMIPYYGGHSCKQFIRGKPIRWGYKFWVGATKIGYIDWFQPYQGKSSTIPSNYNDFGVGGGVVLQYSDALEKRHKGLPFHLYFDNFFSSVPLFHELSNRGLKATGTIRENRLSKCPLPLNKEYKKTERGSYTYKFSQPEGILVCKWNDNSVVTVASNTLKVEPLHKAKRFSQQHKKYINIDQPSIIKQYNENMGGVDRSDQNIGLYRTSIRGKKWYFSLFCHCIDMAVQNAWLLYKADEGEGDHLSFRRSIARSLLETYKKSEKRGPGPTPKSHHETSRYDRIDHLITYLPDQLRCYVCKKKTNFACEKCKIRLHPKNCFYCYHTQ